MFIGVEPGMTVLDIAASAGWYTEVLSIAVGEDGTVYSQNLQAALERRNGANDKALTARLSDDRLSNVVRADGEISAIEPGSIDVAFTALNFHDTYNFSGAEAAAALLAEFYAVLKPGGRAGPDRPRGRPGSEQHEAAPDSKAGRRGPRSSTVDLSSRPRAMRSRTPRMTGPRWSSARFAAKPTVSY